MTKPTKWIYLWVLQGNYGYGWDDLTSDEVLLNVKQDLKDYQDNEGGSYRIIQRRVLRKGV